MASMLGSNRRRHLTPKSRPRRQSLQKPNGVIAPRVQKVGGAHFAIVCVDPAKHRSEWMMADYFGNLLIETQTLQHHAEQATKDAPKVLTDLEPQQLAGAVLAVKRQFIRLREAVGA